MRARQAVNRRIQQHFESLQFNDALLRPNQVTVGFLYFNLSESSKSLDNLVVELSTSEERSGKELFYRLSLPSLNPSGN